MKTVHKLSKRNFQSYFCFITLSVWSMLVTGCMSKGFLNPFGHSLKLPKAYLKSKYFPFKHSTQKFLSKGLKYFHCFL